jgi:hypothetical protein
MVRRVCWLQLVAAVAAILLTGSRGALTWEYRKPTWLLFGLLAAHAYSRRRASRAQPIFEIPTRLRRMGYPVAGAVGRP